MSKCVLLSISRAWSLGRAILRAKNVGKAPHEAVVENQNGRVLITGKVMCTLLTDYQLGRYSNIL